ncbi:hypothetical protein ZIOFF_038180 [Zingiber officinale]|uniref:VAL1-3 N-terminal zinc finger domain-containing protein n=1 Tax=Zingiber officinale TaxID=94328 RepID=A0A8J5GL15_ZINOF|nr:hypothetical protein ZIOFF_038180 [Zingiber officinale]
MLPSSLAAAVAKICFNFQCKEPLPDLSPARRKSWRLLSGEIAELCDRCSYALFASGFPRRSDSRTGSPMLVALSNREISVKRTTPRMGVGGTAKRVHCGCIVSVTAYVLLDAGGVDCVACATKPSAMAPNQMISSPVLVSPLVTERREVDALSFPRSSTTWRALEVLFQQLDVPSSTTWRVLEVLFLQPDNMVNVVPSSTTWRALEVPFQQPDNLASVVPASSRGAVPTTWQALEAPLAASLERLMNFIEKDEEAIQLKHVMKRSRALKLKTPVCEGKLERLEKLISSKGLFAELEGGADAEEGGGDAVAGEGGADAEAADQL